MVMRKMSHYFSKRKLNAFAPTVNACNEIIYQSIFNTQCKRHSIECALYPVGAAANYSLLYLIVRILEENDITKIVELGSGQSTLLIDKLKSSGAKHYCYEDNKYWFERMHGQLTDVDYRYGPLEECTYDGKKHKWYSNVELHDFDLLIVDGPPEVKAFSRFGCNQIIDANKNSDFIIVLDDTNRLGEQDTLNYIYKKLIRKGLDVSVSTISAAKRQTVITTGKYKGVSYYGIGPKAYYYK